MERINRFVAIIWLPIIALSFLRIQPVPPDFAFKVSGMFHDEINTFNGTYSRNGVERPARKQMFEGKLINMISVRDSTVSLELTAQEKREIYLVLDKMDYASYPKNISSKCKSQIIPSHEIQLKIRVNNAVKYISCDDGCQDNSAQIKAFRRLLYLIKEISARHEEVRKLPKTMILDM